MSDQPTSGEKSLEVQPHDSSDVIDRLLDFNLRILRVDHLSTFKSFGVEVAALPVR